LRDVRTAAAKLVLWIAGLSVVNAIMSASGTGPIFLFGLGVTLIIPSIVGHLVAAFRRSRMVCRKGHVWAFIVGIYFVRPGCDDFLLAKNWAAAGFHGYILFRLNSRG